MTSTENIKYIFEVVGDDALKSLNSISEGLDTVGAGFKQLGSVSKSFSRAFNNATKSLGVFNKTLSTLSGIVVGKSLAEGTKSAIDFYETLNLFNVAMKESIDTGEQFIDTVSEWYGMDPKSLMDYTGLFYEMAYAVEAPTEAARILSTSLTALSVDLASLFNVDVERVADNLTSGIRGMSRAVVKYGLDLRATTVEAYANSIGITEQYETMDETSREILRYLVAVKQARDATGDFGRTIEQPANQMRVFKEQVTQLGRAIGSFLVQPLQSLLPIINGTVMALRIMLETIASLVGITTELVSPITGLSDTSTEFENIGASADAARKKVKAFLAPFDELNIMQQQASTSGTAVDVGGVDPILLEQLRQTQYILDEVRMKAMDTRDSILAFFGFVPGEDSWIHAPELFEHNLKSRFSEWQHTIEALFNFDTNAFLSNVSLLFDAFSRIASQAIYIVVQDLANLFGMEITDSTIADWIDNLNIKLFDMRKWIAENEKEIAEWVATLLELGLAFATLATVLGPIGTLLTSLGAGFFLMSNLFAGVSTILSVLNPMFELLGAIFAGIGAGAAQLSTMFLGIKNALGATSTGLVLAGQSGGTFIGVLQTLLGVGSKLSAMIVGLSTLLASLFVGGFIKWMATSDEFKEHLGRWGESLKTIFLGVKDIFGVVFSAMVEYANWVAVTFSGVFDAIVGIISVLMEALAGLVDFIAGVFTGDWERAWNGVQTVFLSFANILNSIMIGVLNLIIIGINRFIVSVINGVTGVINSILGGLSDILDLVGIDVNWSIPAVPEIPPIPVEPPQKFATGGVVTGPTRALIGEAGRAEAVIPLDNSPQMQQLINQIAEAVSTDNRPVEVHVYLEGRSVAMGVYDEIQYESIRRGDSLVK